MAIYIVLGIILIIVFWVIGTYNALVKLRERVRNEWKQVDVQLQKRFDLIPNIVSTVKGYAQHEKTVFEEITKARAQVSEAATPEDKIKAENMLSAGVSRLFAVAENYPDLKANTNFLELQSELSKIESKIADARMFYNDIVMRLNAKIQTFPSNLIAGAFGFKQEVYFNVDEEARKNVKVEF